MELLLSKEETLYLVNRLNDFYGDINSIQDYFIKRKKEKVRGIDPNKYKDYIFDDYSMQPKDMSFSCQILDGDFFQEFCQVITSLPLESQIGRRINVGIKENHTGKYVALVRISSPVLNVKPRNEIFGRTLRNTDVNDYMMNGSIIVPVQPFGYNYLGGKLGALFCVSNESVDLIHQKYSKKYCFFETTSLYGNIKSSSQYDGLEPMIKYHGLTNSDLFLTPNKDVYFEVRDVVRKYYGKPEWGNSLVDPIPSGPKMRELTKMISILTNHLKEYDPEKHKEFVIFQKEKMKAKTQKRYYYSTFGHKKENIIQHITSGGSVPLVRDEPERYDFHNLIEWWKVKAQKRYEKLEFLGDIRKDIEIYTEEKLNKKLEELHGDMIR
jgi:hypothetical protein